MNELARKSLLQRMATAEPMNWGGNTMPSHLAIISEQAAGLTGMAPDGWVLVSTSNPGENGTMDMSYSVHQGE